MIFNRRIKFIRLFGVPILLFYEDLWLFTPYLIIYHHKKHTQDDGDNFFIVMVWENQIRLSCSMKSYEGCDTKQEQHFL